MTIRRTICYTAVGVTLLAVALAAVRRLDPLPQGLRAQYFANTTWSPPSVVSIIDRNPSTDNLIEAWHGALPDAFSTTWTGVLIAPREGTYTLATISDDGSTVTIDGQLVVDNAGVHRAQLGAGSIHLSAGAHRVVVYYMQAGGTLHFELLWARNGAPLEPVPTWALRSGRTGTLPRAVPSLIGDAAFASVEWIWVGVLLLGVGAAVSPAAVRAHGYLEQHAVWPALGWIVAGSALLNVIGIWWGAPGRWVAIELEPEYVRQALLQHFAHGWFDWYPPMHFYVLAVAMSPVLLLEQLGRLSLSSSAGYTLALLSCRLVSVAAGAGIVVAAALCGAHAFGKRAGLFAAAIVGVTTPFVYYAKTANVDVPYLFWVACSFVLYLRMLDGAPMRDYVLFASCAAFAVCTKDQAYALYALVPAVLVHQSWRVNRQAGRSHPFRLALFDTRLVAAAIAAFMVFALCQNWLFDFDGFIKHVRLITGRTVVYFRVFEPTVSGHVRLLETTLHLIRESLGWPLCLVCGSGVVLAFWPREYRRVAVWLLVPVVSYYLGVIDLVLYTYDRFVLPICFVLAMFGGLALDRFLPNAAAPAVTLQRSRGSWRRLAVTGVFAYTLLYAATVDVLMVGDSRYTVERWMKTNIGREDLVATTGLREYLPRIDDFRLIDIGTVAELRQEHPDFVVQNADYATAVAPDSAWGQLIGGLQHGTLGYRLAFRYRRAAPWPWLPGANQTLVGPRNETVVFSILRNINPTIEVFQRMAASSR